MSYTPLRYPGGKGKLATYIKSIFELNHLCDGHYVEPYAGGAGVALELLMLEYASHIHINDIDPAIYAFWYSVLNHTDELCKKISCTRVSMKQWNLSREIYQNPNDYTLLERGFSTFFLNRTNRSGILKGGVIGGKAQAGEWKLDVRYNKQNLIARIEKIASFKNRISLYQQDASEFLIELCPNLPQKTLVYLDPPYYVKGKGLYRNFYTHDDHMSVQKTLEIINTVKWIVSYDNVPEIHSIYEGYDRKTYSLSYTAQKKMQGSEVIIYGPELYYEPEKLPYVPKRSKKVA
jgi:DNA adenine methylase